MKRADQGRWASCRTLDDLAAATVAWLHGEVEQTPGHLGPPCEETISLIPVLSAANLAGFVTEDSQPGVPIADGSGQRAAVSGFASDATVSALTDMADDAGLWVTTWRSSAKRTRYACRVVVSVRHGRPFTGYGAQESREYFREIYDICHPDAVEAICDAWQVTVIDPVYGRNEILWPALEEFALANQHVGHGVALR